ncbi:hypothetical protein D3C87_2211510 [compost metagenome]
MANRFFGIFKIGVAGQDDAFNALVQLPNFFDQLYARHFRHQDIGDDDIDAVGLNQLQRLPR